jgi:hypothetical protein
MSTTAADIRLSTAAQNSVVRSGVWTAVPWYIWCALASVTSAIVGAHWDISWHRSIGRDTFWTPAHIAIYMCGVLAGVAYGYLILSTTFRKHAPLANSSVHILGLRAPLGAFIASWGGVAMLTSAPFDNWWHDAYGLDVTILSPPHVVLFTGVYAVLIGTAVLLAGHLNRAAGREKILIRWLFLYLGGMLTVGAMVLIMELTSVPLLHNSLPYIITSILAPIIMAAMSRVTGVRFAATIVTGFYMLFLIATIQLLPLFPAEPKLGPVYQHVTHFIPPQFPLLLIVPAFFLDLFWQRAKHWSRWALAVGSAVLFVASLVAVEYPFASFLMSPASRNSFFGTGYLPFGVSPQSFMARHIFYVTDSGPQFLAGILIAMAVCTLTTWFGFKRGDWMRQVQR